MSTIEEFVAKLQKEQEEGYIAIYGNKYPDLCRNSCCVTVSYGKKYARVDVGRSGKYMVVLATGDIYGIKAYGVIHPGHFYGTLETIDVWDWKGYTATKKKNK